MIQLIWTQPAKCDTEWLLKSNTLVYSEGPISWDCGSSLQDVKAEDGYCSCSCTTKLLVLWVTPLPSHLNQITWFGADRAFFPFGEWAGGTASLCGRAAASKKLWKWFGGNGTCGNGDRTKHRQYRASTITLGSTIMLVSSWEVWFPPEVPRTPGQELGRAHALSARPRSEQVNQRAESAPACHRKQRPCSICEGAETAPKTGDGETRPQLGLPLPSPSKP